MRQLPDVVRDPSRSNCPGRRMTTAFLVLSLIGSTLFAIFNPPFMVPDEQQHFARAYQLTFAPGQVVVQNGRVGAILPSSIVEFPDKLLHTRDLHGTRLVEPHPFSDTLATLTQPLDPARTEFIDFSGAAFYAPLPYLPQMAGMALARAAGTGPTGLLYAGRLANALCATLIAWLAVRLIGGAAPGLAAIGLLPMTQYLFGSLSPDAAIIACSMLAAAVAARAVAAGRWTTGQLLLAIAAGLVVCSLKPVYAPLLLVGAVATLQRAGLRHAALVYSLLVGVVVACSLAWLSLSKSIFVQPVPGTDVAAQTALILVHPQTFALALLHGAQTSWLQWLLGVLGLFGWLNLALPIALYGLVLLTLGASLAASATPAPGRLEAAWTSLLVLASAALVAVALYIYWNPVGAPVLLGIQGRYLLPLAAAAVFSLSAWRGHQPPRSPRYQAAALACSFLLVTASVAAIIRAYAVL